MIQLKLFFYQILSVASLTEFETWLKNGIILLHRAKQKYVNKFISFNLSILGKTEIRNYYESK